MTLAPIDPVPLNLNGNCSSGEHAVWSVIVYSGVGGVFGSGSMIKLSIPKLAA